MTAHTSEPVEGENPDTTPVFSLPRLRAYLDRRGIPYADLADRIGITEAELNEIDYGITTPTPEILARLAQALDCTPQDFTVAANDNPTSNRHYWAAIWATAPPMTQAEIAAIGHILRTIANSNRR